jgi:hypothetical protein
VVLNSGTLTFTADNQVNAIFGATTVLGCETAGVTTTSTDNCIRLEDGTVSIFADDTHKATLDSAGLKVFEGSASVPEAIFGSTTTIGQIANSSTRVQIESDNVKLINRSSGGSDSTIIEFNSSGTITSEDYLIEKSRLFGFGADGTLVLSTGDFTVADGGNGAGTKVSNAAFTDGNGTANMLTRSGAVYTMNGDLYFYDLTLNSGVTLATNGCRLFVFGTLTNGGTIDNSGGAGGNASDATRTNASNGNPGTVGSAGAQSGGVTLAAGAPGKTGGASSSSTISAPGGHGGGSGAGGGIVFISARILAGAGNCFAKGGDGGDGGNGAPFVSSPVTSNSGTGTASTSGGAGGGGAATTRIDVIDPHLLLPFRDIMSTSETAPRLKPAGGAGSGGSGGSGATISAGDVKNGVAGADGDSFSNCLIAGDGAAGGTGGVGSTTQSGPGGGGGGGGGGAGGVIFIISTTVSSPWTHSVIAGVKGGRGNPGTAGGANAATGGGFGANGTAGKDVFIQV